MFDAILPKVPGPPTIEVGGSPPILPERGFHYEISTLSLPTARALYWPLVRRPPAGASPTRTFGHS
eukprot:9049929-Pyramimonas_sp.AAC.1